MNHWSEEMRLTERFFLLSAAVAMAVCGSAFGQGKAEPAEGSKDVPVNVVLKWDGVANAKGYEVYFAQGGEPVFQCKTEKPTFMLETLTAGKEYRWRVDALVDGKAVPGAVQKFTTVAKADRDAMYDWSIRMAKSVRILYPQPQNLGEWNYTQGMVADALVSIAARTGRDADVDFVKGWLDRYVGADGKIAGFDSALHSLDRLRPGPALLWVYEKTKDEKYLKAANFLAAELDAQPKTTDGGYWHRQTYPNQMWLDGIYMADIFSAEYGAMRKEPKYLDDAVKQITVIAKHTHDPKTGLFYHGWDETKTRPWANKDTGASPEFWGRAIGWYAMAMADILEWLPADHPGRAEVMGIYKGLCESLLKFQDHDTGMWWQIMDKPTGPKNYVETSCSIMFAEAMARGALHGWLGPEYLEAARRGARGIMNKELDVLPSGRIDIRGTVSVGSLGGNGGFYDYYVGVNVATNDQKSIGAFMYLTMALSETANDTGPGSKELPRHGP
jgi:unsaturated rhamnogalacturonyl hydrolase